MSGEAVRASNRIVDSGRVYNETRELWAIRWADGSISGAMYAEDGSDYAEQAIRFAAGGEEVVHCTETITRSPWEPAPPTQPVREGGAADGGAVGHG